VASARLAGAYGSRMHVWLNGAFGERIAAGEIDPGALDFRLENVRAYAEARPWMIAAADLVVDVVRSSPDEAAAQVLAAVSSMSP
jgi:hypothetical protein